MPRHFALGLVCAAALSACSVQAKDVKQPAERGLRQAINQSTAPTLAPGAAQGVRSADYIVAVVNSEPVTNNEVRSRIQRVLQNMAAQGVQPLPAPEQIASEVVERLIVEKAQIQMAKESGIRVDDYAVNQALENMARQNNMSLDAMRQEMRAEGIEEQTFREEIRNQMLVQRLQDREVDGRVKVSEQDIDQYLAEQQQSGGAGADMESAAINLGHILIEVPERVTEAQMKQLQARAQEALQAARTNPNFEEVAKRYSDTGQPVLGMRPASRYPGLFIQAVGSTAVGGVADVVRSPAGFHILKVLEKTSAGAQGVVTQNHARHILLRTSPQLSEQEAAQRLSELRQRLEGGASFESLARQYSEDGSARNGGDLGWAGPGRYVPEFDQALNALQPGQVSQPVVSRFGVHLIQLVDRRQATLSPREQREMLRDTVREQKLEKAQATWLQELRAQAYVEYREPPH